METKVNGKPVDVDALIKHMVDQMPQAQTVDTAANHKKIWDLHNKLREVSLEVPYMAEAAEIWKLCNAAMLEIGMLRKRTAELKFELIKETYLNKYSLAGR